MPDKREEFESLFETVDRVYTLDGSRYANIDIKKGLRNRDGTGVLVGLTNIGEVHGYVIEEMEKMPDEGKLSYRGIDLEELVQGFQEDHRFGFEEVVYLLLMGGLPSPLELNDMQSYMDEVAPLPEGFVEDMIFKAPSPNIMNKLARCVLASYSYDKAADDISTRNVLRQSMELIARFPTFVAYSYAAKAHYCDNKSLIIHNPLPGRSIAENFLHMIRPDGIYTDEEARVLDLALVVHAEHGGGNNSAFATHVLSSSGTDTYSAIAAAVGSLKGPKHGGANAKVIGMIEDIKAHVSNTNDEGALSDYLIKILNKEAYDNSGLIYGMGHAIYTLSDPRAVLLKEQARVMAQKTDREEEFMLYESIERLTPELLRGVKGNDKVVCANVDMYSGFVYQCLDIPPELYTPLFAISRIAGWCAHRLEEIRFSSRIIRPAYKSVTKHKNYVPLSDR
ncbi:MAG: citrate/2-methylcitrate synthase [Clostridia bacterium]|nr:citrate/2-methylcitrate synthase [Clostridia bacterium]